MSGFIRTKEQKLEHLTIVSMQWRTINYKWAGSVYDYICWSVKKWNNKESQKINMAELHLHPCHVDELKQAKFNKETE